MKRSLILTFIVLLGFDIGAYAQSWYNNGPYAGLVKAIVKSHSGEIIAATDGGIYRFQDESQAWNYRGGGRTILNITLGPDKYLFTASSNFGIYRSDNDGLNWERLSAPPPTPVYDVTYNNQDQTLLAGTKEGLYFSDDLGDSWESVDDSLLAEASVDQILITKSRIVVRTDSGIFQKNIKEAGWKYVGHSEKEILYITEDSFGSLWAFVRYEGLLRLRQNATDWEYRGLKDNYITHILFASDGYIYASGSTLHKSNDNGATWHDVQFPYIINSISEFEGNSFWLATERFGIYNTADFESFDENNTLLTNLFPLSFKEDVNANLYLTSRNGVHISRDYGVSWESVYTRTRGFYSRSDANALSTGEIFYVTSHGEIFKQNEAQGEWIEVFDTGTNFYPSIAVSRNGKIFVSSEKGKLFRSTNQGEKWEEVFSKADEKFYAVSALNDTIGVASDDGIYISENGGDNWRHSLIGESVFDVIISPTGLFVCKKNRDVKISHDTGHTWVSIHDSQSAIQSLAVDEDNNIFIIKNFDIFYSKDLGQNWEQFTNEGLKTSPDEIFCATQGRIFCLTIYNGIFQNINPISRITVIKSNIAKYRLILKLPQPLQSVNHNSLFVIRYQRHRFKHLQSARTKSGYVG